MKTILTFTCDGVPMDTIRELMDQDELDPTMDNISAFIDDADVILVEFDSEAGTARVIPRVEY